MRTIVLVMLVVLAEAARCKAQQSVGADKRAAEWKALDHQIGDLKGNAVRQSQKK